MKLKLYTDYSLRVLIYLGVHDEILSTISEISESYGISRNHLVKVVHNLANLGYVVSTRGNGGGIRLSRPAKDINIGDVIRKTEGGFEIVECLGKNTNTCRITKACALKNAVNEALAAFIQVLDKYCLTDVLQNKDQLESLLRYHAPG